MLNSVAVRKIREITEELKGHYSSVDEPLVVAYAKTYQRWLEIEAIVDKEGIVEQSSKTGAIYLSPYFTALQSTLNNLTKLGDKLGLSIASRKRLNMKLNQEEKTNSLFDFINEIKESEDEEIVI